MSCQLVTVAKIYILLETLALGVLSLLRWNASSTSHGQPALSAIRQISWSGELNYQSEASTYVQRGKGFSSVVPEYSG